MDEYTERPALVVGGAGFVGAWVVRRLLEAGRTVRVFDRDPLDRPDIEMVVGDLTDAAAVARACAGVGSVFHCASLVDWGAGRAALLEAVNVQGARNVVAGCLEHGVLRLIYTSSIDVVFDGTPIRNGDESLPYPRRHLDDYGRTKMEGEALTLAASGQQGLRTCALRLAGVYGPGDRHRFPSILRVARKQPLPRMGNGRGVFNHVYVENVAQAHLDAERALAHSAVAAGQAYFITDAPPSNFYAFFDPYLTALGLRPARWALPTPVALAMAHVAEGWQRLTRRPTPPMLTRYSVLSTVVDFWFTHAKATRDLDYVPQIDAATARQRTLEWLRTLPE